VPLTAILIGAGYQGHAVYSPYALSHPEDLHFVAVAEPQDSRRARLAQEHSIPRENQFRTWEDLLSRKQMADVAFVCTPDRLHVAPAIAALESGYDVLLEKPMATTLADCVRLVQATERTGRLLQLCHILRYADFFSTLHDIVASGRLGDVVTVEHRENLLYWHMAHSYVRGDWRSSEASSMILTKCCHDFDILYWNLGPCTRVSSFGSLNHFRIENAPAGAPERCTDGCPASDKCPWYAPRLYLDLVPAMRFARHSHSAVERVGATLFLDHPRLVRVLRRLIPPLDAAFDYRGWPISVISEDTSPEARLCALQTGPYGRCVYRCDNDVVDHQTVNLEFGSGASGMLVMQGHSHEQTRTMRYDGTRATLRGRFSYGNDSAIEIHDHLTGCVERIVPHTEGRRGGQRDEKMIASFLRAVRDPSCALTTAGESLESHLMAFAAEEARLSGTVVDLNKFRVSVTVPGRWRPRIDW
jgi:predicted dehydrogenase